MCINSNVNGIISQISNVKLKAIDNPTNLNDIFNKIDYNTICISAIQSETPEQIVGFPINTHGYGCLLTIKPIVYETSCMQIYIPHILDHENERNRGLYFRIISDFKKRNSYDPKDLKWRRVEASEFVSTH